MMQPEYLQKIADILTEIDREEMRALERENETTIYTAEDLQDVEKMQLIIDWLTTLL